MSPVGMGRILVQGECTEAEDTGVGDDEAGDVYAFACFAA